MVLSDELIVQFQDLYKKHYGIEITKQQAMLEGVRLARLVQVVMLPQLSTTLYEEPLQEKRSKK